MSSPLIPPHRSSRRAALLEQLIAALPATGQYVLPIRTRAPDDPTIALLDAWATVGDVLGFYSDRIAEEGYLATASQPGSILALASLVGYQPAPGLAAQVYLAFTLAPDAADGAVRYSPGLLFQSVPGPGQQPQTFESAAALTARPSWNLLAPQTTQPVPASTTSLVVGGTTAGLSPNDVILLALAAGNAPQPMTVTQASVNYAAKVTKVTLQAPTVPPPSAAAAPAPAAPAAFAAAAPAAEPAGEPPQTTTAAIDTLLAGSLGKAPAPVPGSANQLPQTAQSVFGSGSDTVPRLITTLQPAVAPRLYAALASTPIGSAAVIGASAMRVKAAPFGAAAPPRPVFNASGQPAGSLDWPIGDTFTLQLTMTAADLAGLLQQAGGEAPDQPESGLREWTARLLADHRRDTPSLNVQLSAGTFVSQAVIDLGSSPASAVPPPQGFGAVTVTYSEGFAMLSYAGSPPSTAATATSPPPTPPLQISARFSAGTGTVTLEFADPGPPAGQGQSPGAPVPLRTVVWDLTVRAPLRVQVGAVQLSITPPVTQGRDSLVTAVITVPLPLPDHAQKVLLLDGVYPGIVTGSHVLITSADQAAARYPVLTTVTTADTVAASAYGLTGKVTRLALADQWISADAVQQTALRPLTVHAQPETLPLQPAVRGDEVAGFAIDLGGLVAGMEPGRLIAVTGTRSDLPASATVQTGEIAMVASVSTGGEGGETAFSTLHLARPLAYRYQRATVKIYGNVVPAHQGATVSQVLGSGQPAQAPQRFTLTSGPLLADPAGAAATAALTVTVDGAGYVPVSRFDASTPAQSFLTGTDPAGQTTITFPAPLPPGSGNITASYRTGHGDQGNVQAGQITQLLSRPPSLSSVTNPLPASGGSAGPDQETVRASAPASLSALGKIVTVSDFAAVAAQVPGVGKAAAAGTAASGVAVTIAGTSAVQLDPGGSLCAAVAATLAAAAGPAVQVLPASLYLIALTATVAHDPLVSWDATVTAVQASIAASFGYAQRGLGQDVAVSDLIAAVHAAPGVRSCVITGLALVPATASAAAISTTLPALLTTKPVPPVVTLAAAAELWELPPVPGPAPVGVAYASAAASGTLILTEQAP